MKGGAWIFKIVRNANRAQGTFVHKSYIIHDSLLPLLSLRTKKFWIKCWGFEGGTVQGLQIGQACHHPGVPAT